MSDEFDPMLSLPEPFGRSAPVIDPALVDGLKDIYRTVFDGEDIREDYDRACEYLETLRVVIAALEAKHD